MNLKELKEKIKIFSEMSLEFQWRYLFKQELTSLILKEIVKGNPQSKELAKKLLTIYTSCLLSMDILM